MSTTVQSMTAADLLCLPADGRRYELIQGELRQMSPAGPLHGRLTMRIAAHLFHYVEAHALCGIRSVKSKDSVSVSLGIHKSQQQSAYDSHDAHTSIPILMIVPLAMCSSCLMDRSPPLPCFQSDIIDLPSR